jgi:molybdate transport system ATP-binding protein
VSGALAVRVAKRVHAGLRLDVDFSLGPEVGVLFGRSGAGKTTLLRLIAGLARPDAGTIRLGADVLFDDARRIHVALRRRRIGMIFQDDRLFPHLDAAGNIRFGLKGWPRAEADARAADVAHLCGVAHRLDRRVEQLSGGERQRVGLARALAPWPRLLLCDEPVSALDLDARFALLARLKAIQRSEGIPIVYVTHSPAEAVAVGDRLFLLRDGRIAADGAPLDVLGAAGPGASGWAEPIRNFVRGVVAAHDPARGETHVRLEGPAGPTLIVPHADRPIGTRLAVLVRADDILLARGPLDAAGLRLSARNRLAGAVERVVAHDHEAEVLVRTGSFRWVVAVVASAVSGLDLAPGAEVTLIIKARACRVLDEPGGVPESDLDG